MEKIDNLQIFFSFSEPLWPFSSSNSEKLDISGFKEQDCVRWKWL